MSWLLGRPAGRDDVLDLRPDLAGLHRALLDTVWSGPVHPVTLELCRLRMAMLHRAEAALAERSPAAVAAGLDEDRVARLAQWPTDPSFSAEERACLAFAELFVIDHHGITDADADAVLSHLGPKGMVTFTTALGIWDGQHAFDKALGVTAGEKAG